MSWLTAQQVSALASASGCTRTKNNNVFVHPPWLFSCVSRPPQRNFLEILPSNLTSWGKFCRNFSAQGQLRTLNRCVRLRPWEQWCKIHSFSSSEAAAVLYVLGQWRMKNLGTIDRYLLLIPKTIGNRKRDCAWGCARGINTTWENLQIEKHKSGRRSLRSPDWFVLFDLQIFWGGVYPPSATSRTISFSISNSFWSWFD